MYVCVCVCVSQGSYNGPLYLGDFWCLMNGMLNIYYLRHDSRSSDCAINSFRRQNSRERTCFMQQMKCDQTLLPLTVG